LASDRVASVLAGKEPPRGKVNERIKIALEDSPPEQIAETQAQARQRFQDLFARGYLVTWFERAQGGGAYILENERVTIE
jgi:predicted GNAT superfamily acetyltransferase